MGVFVSIGTSVLILAYFGLPVAGIGYIGKKRGLSLKAKLMAFAAVLVFGPIGLLSLAFAKKNGAFAKGYTGKLQMLDKDIKELENKIAKINRKLRNTDRPHLQTKLAKLEKELDNKIIEKAHVYDPVLSSYSDDGVITAKAVVRHHDEDFRNMMIDDNEKEYRIKKIRENYMALNDKDKLGGHLNKLKI